MIIEVKIGLLQCDSIGRFAGTTEFYLRKKTFYPKKKRHFHIFFSGSPVNRQLLNMIKRRLFVLESNFLYYIFNKIKKYYPKSRLWVNLDSTGWYYQDIWNNTVPQLTFTPEEHIKGKQILTSLGIRAGETYICFHIRDKDYSDSSRPRDQWWYNNDFRNFGENEILKALERFVGEKVWAIRMGINIKKALKTCNPRIIDYAFNSRTDFADIYISAHCKFYVGNTAGIYLFASIFGVPVAYINMAPLGESGRTGKDLFILKKYYSRPLKRYLLLREVIALGSLGEPPPDINKEKNADPNDRTNSLLFARLSKNQLLTLVKMGIQIVENDSEEIFDLLQEMELMIDEGRLLMVEDLRQKYLGLFPKDHLIRTNQSNIAGQFLLRHKLLLE